MCGVKEGVWGGVPGGQRPPALCRVPYLLVLLLYLITLAVKSLYVTVPDWRLKPLKTLKRSKSLNVMFAMFIKGHILSVKGKIVFV